MSVLSLVFGQAWNDTTTSLLGSWRPEQQRLAFVLIWSCASVPLGGWSWQVTRREAAQSSKNMMCTRGSDGCELKRTRSPWRLLIAFAGTPLLKQMITKNLCVFVCVFCRWGRRRYRQLRTSWWRETCLLPSLSKTACQPLHSLIYSLIYSPWGQHAKLWKWSQLSHQTDPDL